LPLLEVNDHQLHVVDRGAGDAVVFLHAFPLQAAMWDYQIDALEATHRCLAVDLPGFGGSSLPADPGRASMQQWAGLVAGALDQLDVAEATVVGCSMGGYLAMAMLRHHRDRVARLVLADTKARSDDAAAAGRRTELQRQVRSGTEITALAKGMVEGMLSGSSMARADLVSYVHALTDGATPEGWIAALEAMKSRPDSMLLLRQARGVPAMAMVGELDRLSPIAEAMSVRSLLKGELVVVPNVGHLPNIEDPIAFNEALTNFLGVDPADAAADATDAADASPDEASADDASAADASAADV
jgi:3-oxoadipate enol-lactonase